MIEALMVMVIIAILVAVTAPRIAVMNESSSLRASRQILGSAFAAARSAAIQKGQQSTITLTSNSATVRVLSGLNRQTIVVMGPLRFDKSLNTTLVPINSAPTTITFDVRGMASPRLSEITRYELRAPNRRDTLCVSATGMLLQKDCKL
jgi:type II secretory pathway pseudopilin PulG